jgi:hypothetical protein
VRALGRAMRTDSGGVLRTTSRSERSMWAGQQLSLFHTPLVVVRCTVQQSDEALDANGRQTMLVYEITPT